MRQRVTKLDAWQYAPEVLGLEKMGRFERRLLVKK